MISLSGSVWKTQFEFFGFSLIVFYVQRRTSIIISSANLDEKRIIMQNFSDEGEVCVSYGEE